MTQITISKMHQVTKVAFSRYESIILSNCNCSFNWRNENWSRFKRTHTPKSSYRYRSAESAYTISPKNLDSAGISANNQIEIIIFIKIIELDYNRLENCRQGC